MRGFGQHRLELVQRDIADVLAGAHQVERGVDGGAVEEARHVADRLGVGVALHHPQEDGLEHVFGIARVAGDPVRRAEHHGMVFAEDLFQVLDGKFADSIGAAISAFILSGSS